VKVLLTLFIARCSHSYLTHTSRSFKVTYSYEYSNRVPLALAGFLV